MTVHFLSQHRIGVPGHTLSGRNMSAAFLAPCPMERDNAGDGARAWALTAETSCPLLAKWARWEGLSRGPNEDMVRKRSEGKLEAWTSGTLPTTDRGAGSQPHGLLGTKSLSGMNVLLCKVLACPESDCEVEGPWKSQPLRHGIIEAQSQVQVGFQELQGLQVLALKGVRSLALGA